MDFISGPADAFLANIADGFIASFVGFALFAADFRELYHDELAVAAVLGIELHDGVGGGGGAGEEVEKNLVFTFY